MAAEATPVDYFLPISHTIDGTTTHYTLQNAMLGVSDASYLNLTSYGAQFTKSAGVTGAKYNFYFFADPCDNTNWPDRKEDIYKLNGLTLNDISQIEVDVDFYQSTSLNIGDNMYFVAYTKPTGDIEVDFAWYRSSAIVLNSDPDAYQYNSEFGRYTLKLNDSSIYANIGTTNENTKTTADSITDVMGEELLALSFQSNNASNNLIDINFSRVSITDVSGNEQTLDLRLNTAERGGPVETNSAPVTVLANPDPSNIIVGEIDSETRTNITSAINLLKNNDSESSVLGLSGATGDQFVVPPGYNRAFIYKFESGALATGYPKIRDVSQGDVLTFESNAALVNDSNAVSLVLDEFNSSVTMNLLPEVDTLVQQTVTSDADARIYVSLEQFRRLFQFQVDASDIDTVKDSGDIQYKTVVSELDTSSNLNPFAALVESGFTGSNLYDSDHLCVRHDYVRKMAKDIFNTEKAVDIFENETELLDDLVSLGNTVNTNIKSDIENANGLLESDDISANLVKRLIDQMLELKNSRFDVNGGSSNVYVMQDTNDFQAVPFNENDTIRFKLTVDPSSNADGAVLSELPGPKQKTYEIILHLSSKTNKGIGFDNQVPNDNGSSNNSTDNYYSYVEPEP